MSAHSPEERTRALLYYFGWQGGTIHQLAKATGCDADMLLYGVPPRELTNGFSAVRTCDLAWRRDRLAPQHQGDWPYWHSVVRGFWATGPLDRKET